MDLGVWGRLGRHFTVNKLAQKLCRNILLHFGLVTFRIDFWENPTTHNFHGFEFGGLQKPKILIFGGIRIFQTSQEKCQNFVQKYCVWKSINYENRRYQFFEKTGADIS